MTPGSSSSAVKEGTKKLEMVIYLIIVIAFIGALFNIPWSAINWVIQLLVSVFVGSVLSLISGSIVEVLTADWLKIIAFNIEIKDFRISITVFTLATFFVKVLLFGL